MIALAAIIFGVALFVLVLTTIWYRLYAKGLEQELQYSARLLSITEKGMKGALEKCVAAEKEVRLLLSERGQIEKQARADALKRSQSAMKGKVGENMAPFLDDFPYTPTDCHFMGNPIDYLVFEGYSTGEITGITFLEIKTGKSALTTGQRRIRDAIKDGKVSWAEYKVKEEL